MTAINGTNLAAPIVPFTTDDNFATHCAKYGQGGLHSVETIAERDAIPASRLEVGMLVYVSTEAKTYQLTDIGESSNTWELFVGSGGTNNYNDLSNKPAIDGVTLTSSTTKTDLGLADVYRICGSVDTYDDLADIVDPENGDAYRVIDEGKLYAWDGTEWFDMGGNESISTLGLIVPDTSAMHPIDEKEFYMNSSSAYYQFLSFPNESDSLRSINGNCLFRITVTGDSINTTIEGVINMRQRVGEAPYVVVRNKPGTKTAANTGIRYLRLVYPKSLNNEGNWYFELRAYNTRERHVKVELFKADPGFELIEGEISTYNSSLQSNTLMTLYTTDGLVGSETLSWNTVSSDKAGYITSYLPKFVSGGTMPLCGEAIPANSLCFMSDGKIYTSSQKLMAIDPDFGVQVCMVATKINAAIAYTSLRQKEAVTSLTQVPHDELTRGAPCFLRCKIENGKIFSDNLVTTSMAAGFTWYYLGVAASSKAINIDTTQSCFISLNADGELERINGKSLDSYTKAEVDAKIELLQAGSDVRDIVGTYQELLDYPTENLMNGDVIEILEDEEHDGTATYYRWVIDAQNPQGHWVYVGERGPYYTKRQTRDLIRDAVAAEALIRESRDNEIIEQLDGMAKYGMEYPYSFNIPYPTIENEGKFLFINDPGVNYCGEVDELPEDAKKGDLYEINGTYAVYKDGYWDTYPIEENTLRMWEEFDRLYDLYVCYKNVWMKSYKTSTGYKPYGDQYVYTYPDNEDFISIVIPGEEDPSEIDTYIYARNEAIITQVCARGAGYGYLDANDDVCYWHQEVEKLSTGPIEDGASICDEYHNPIYAVDEDDGSYYELQIIFANVAMEEIIDVDGNVYRRAPEYDKVYYGFVNSNDDTDIVFFYGDPDKASFTPGDVYVEESPFKLIPSELTVENYDVLTKTVTLSNGEEYTPNELVRTRDIFNCQMPHTKSQDLYDMEWKPLSNYGGSGAGGTTVTFVDWSE